MTTIHPEKQLPSHAEWDGVWRAEATDHTSGFADAKRRTRVFSLLQIPYADALEMQRKHHTQLVSGQSTMNALYLLEHPHVYTLGRGAEPGNLLKSPEMLREQGVNVVETDRGGDITYHGPGQLVGYPILDLKRWKKDVDAYVTSLEEVVIRTLDDFDITGERDARGRGVWVSGKKICSVGVKVSRWVTLHGFALNVNTDLSYFQVINPCGFNADVMTTMTREGLPEERLGEVREVLLTHFAKVFETRLSRESEHELRRSQRPAWLKAPMPDGPKYRETKKVVDDHKLNTVCESANCPNRGECWSQGTATFMINGNVCTRSCSFCDVFTGKPLQLNPHEPEAVADAAAQMNLEHVVITAVNRDELADGGASQFAATIRSLRLRMPESHVEVLVPDFLGKTDAIDAVIDARPDVFNHNIETVPRLYKPVRPQAIYQRSLDVLQRASDAGLVTKSGIMVGLGEENDEVLAVLRDLRSAGVQIVTIGQYLRPSERHHPIVRYVHPDEFAAWRNFGLHELGFREVASGPLVRSSYHAKESFHAAQAGE
jgi:lipoic acid synthetase